jgi:hypothetical protein
MRTHKRAQACLTEEFTELPLTSNSCGFNLCNTDIDCLEIFRPAANKQSINFAACNAQISFIALPPQSGQPVFDTPFSLSASPRGQFPNPPKNIFQRERMLVQRSKLGNRCTEHDQIFGHLQIFHLRY